MLLFGLNQLIYGSCSFLPLSLQVSVGFYWSRSLIPFLFSIIFNFFSLLFYLTLLLFLQCSLKPLILLLKFFAFSLHHLIEFLYIFKTLPEFLDLPA
jgi:hypothetical protein